MIPVIVKMNARLGEVSNHSFKKCYCLIHIHVMMLLLVQAIDIKALFIKLVINNILQ